MLSPIQPSMAAPVRFGKFSAEQEARLKTPSSGDIEDVFQRHMPTPTPDVSGLPEMDAAFADELSDAMSEHFVNYFMSPLDEGAKAGFRTDLKDITDRLREAPFTVPEKVMEAIAGALELIND